MFKTIMASTFLIGHKNQTKTNFRHNAGRLQTFGKNQHGTDSLLIVLHPAPINKIASLAYCPGIMMPGGQISGSDCIQMAKNPQILLCAALDTGNKIGAIAAGNAVIRAINMQYVFNTHFLQQVRYNLSPGCFACTAIFGAKRFAGSQKPLQFKNSCTLVTKGFKKLLGTI